MSAETDHLSSIIVHHIRINTQGLADHVEHGDPLMALAMAQGIIAEATKAVEILQGEVDRFIRALRHKDRIRVTLKPYAVVEGDLDFVDDTLVVLVGKEPIRREDILLIRRVTQED